MMQNNFLWWRDRVIYQIYPRSFRDSNGDGIGDLNGIRSRLEYLVELGVSALWLSPIYPSPDVDFGYDVSDYCAIDPKFGSMQDFETLLQEAHARGLRIILDLVLNHTSDQHAWFRQSRQDRTNPYQDWYLWRDPAPNGGPPNNWLSMTGGPGWEFVPERGQYYFHLYYRQQPDLNWHNPAVRKAIMDVMRFWLDKGVDGFRLDIVNAYFKDDQFRNNPRKFGLRPFDMQEHLYDSDRPEMLPLLKDMRALVDEKPERYLVGEPFIPIPPLNFLYSGTAARAARYAGPDRLHAILCFDLLHSNWNAHHYQRAIRDWESALAGTAWPTYVLGNHDNPRPATRLAIGEQDARLKVAAMLLMTLGGTPFIYNGDEIGMRDIKVPRSQIQDPVGKKYWPIYPGRDGCRAPMQWNAQPGAGFTSSDHPWLAIHPDFITRNVHNQRNDPDSLLTFYRKLIHLRQQFAHLVSGQLVLEENTPHSILAYRKQAADQQALICLNFSSRPVQLTLPVNGSQSWQVLLSTHRPTDAQITQSSLLLEGNEGLVLNCCR